MAKNLAGVTAGVTGVAFAVLAGGGAFVAALLQGRLLAAGGFLLGYCLLVALNLSMIETNR